MGMRLSSDGVPSEDDTGEPVALVNDLGRQDFQAQALRLQADGTF